MPDDVSLRSETDAQTLTAALANRISAMRLADMPPAALTVAKQCLLDWMGVALAGRNEPLVRILIDELAPADDPGGVSILGHGRRARLDDAVLINGAMGHALDFDDVIMPMGHPTVPVAPVVFALAEQRGASGAEALAAFIAGVETECRIARLLGPSHYAKGWHTTATTGTFGAAAAAARLLGVERRGADPRVRPRRHAGGRPEELLRHDVQAAAPRQGGAERPAGRPPRRPRLHQRHRHSGVRARASSPPSRPRADPAAALAERDAPWVVEALFKYHAACYLTHDSIEAANQLRAEEGVAPEAIEAVTREGPGRPPRRLQHPGSPATGLECKFSLRMTTALALSGEDTFQDAALQRRHRAAARTSSRLRERVSIDPTQTGRGCVVTVRLKDGRELSRTGDVSQPLRDLAAQQAKLERKFRHLATAALGEAGVEEAIELCRALDAQPNVARLAALLRG